MKITKFSLICLLTFSFYLNVISQNIIRGKVFDSETGDPIAYADIIVLGSQKGSTTDLDGFYSLGGLSQGSYRIFANFIGYDTTSILVNLGANSIINQNFYIKPKGFLLNTVDITGQRTAARTEVQISKISVSQADIKLLPSLGGEPDLAQYLQVIPGVVSTGDQGGQLFIRGGAPVQNKILLDGLNIYNPFHSLGLFSSFETDIIKNVDVYTAGFDGYYGGRTSAVVDIKTRDGDKKRLKGFASVSPFVVRGLLETPIKKFEEGKTSVSALLTMKKSLINQTDELFYKNASVGDSVGLPFDFQDIYGKVSINTDGGSSFQFFGFNFSDSYSNAAIANINWKNTGIGTNFKLVPPYSTLILDGTIGFTSYLTDIVEGNDQPRESKINELGGNINFNYYADRLDIKYGIDFRAISTDFEFTNPFGFRLNQNQNTSEVGGFFKLKYKLGSKLIVEPSIRIMYYAGQQKFSPEPRLNLKANLTNTLRFKLGTGLYSQNIISTSNDRDIVNLFNGFLTGPEEPVLGINGQQLGDKLVKARHLVVGFEKDIKTNNTINLEGYYKDFPQIIIVNRNKLSNQESNYATEEGYAYGIDLSFKSRNRYIDLWTTYSYGFVRRFDGRQEYPAVFDRRHNMNIVFTYHLSSSKNTSLGLRWNFGSGFPFTQTRGFYNELPLSTSNTDYHTANPGSFGVIYSTSRNGGRLPDYHRLDLSFTHKFSIIKSVRGEFNISAVNTYNRDNIFYFDRIRYNRVNQLPFMPAASFRIDF
jgi:hypothetical protein